ncbi:MAG: hypothetical protein IIW33_04450 [Oscillospiraceae bacterium]|nr:hypothetical protein [Oscillospiraceae bacterium]
MPTDQRYDMLNNTDRDEAIRLMKIKQGLIPDTESEAYQREKEEREKAPVTLEERWNNFWYHYKWTVMVVTLALIAGAFLTYQAFTRERYDTTLLLGTYTYYSDAQLEEISDGFEKYMSDADENGEVNVGIFQAKYIGENSDDQPTGYEGSMHARIMSEIASGENCIFIVEKDILDSLSEEGVFADLKELSITEQSTFGVCLKDSELLSSKGFEKTKDNLYIALRVYKKGTDLDNYNAQKEALSRLCLLSKPLS